MRIVILGNSGSGKSTLARRLGADLGIPVFHMDRLHWKPRWQESTDEELLANMEEAMRGESWIIDGNYSRVLKPRLERAQVAIVLDIPVWISLLRVAKRWLIYMGRTRPDMGDGCREKWTVDPVFFKWIVTWPRRKQRTYARLTEHPQLVVKVLGARFDYLALLAKLRTMEVAAAPSAAAQPPVDQDQTAAH